jgi:hypothetical protein
MDSTKTITNTHKYPSGLVDWAGHHSGGVRRLFDDNSGRPNKVVLTTNLLARLESWSHDFLECRPNTPRILLLVGGPGNGKTEAIESTIRWLDSALNCGQHLVNQLAKSFHVRNEKTPRIVHLDASRLANPQRSISLAVVQDASVTAGQEKTSAAELLIDELTAALTADPSDIYLCCVNRGILDDALILALEKQLDVPQQLLEAITRSVSMAPDAPSCWPLAGFNSVGVWPMDAESLLVKTDSGISAPASVLFDQALTPDQWPALGTCAGQGQCPFCTSKDLLSHDTALTSLLKILRWYELGSGKRWSFRDLFSLVSYLLAGYQPSDQQQVDPCIWAANLQKLDNETINKTVNRNRSSAIFVLATSSYQHLLFHRWDSQLAGSLLKDIKDVDLDKDHTMMGFYHFLNIRKGPYLPATIASLLEGINDALDPALASPDQGIQVSAKTTLNLREIDARFSRSVGEGYDFIRKYQFLSFNEAELLRRLAKVDMELSASKKRAKKPTAANRIQRLLRDFSCRIVRRNIGTKCGVVLDSNTLTDFQGIVDDEDKSGDRLYAVAKEVENLLNHGDNFEVSLTTTFGQPLPSLSRQATLIVPKRKVKIKESQEIGRPRSPICFLRVGDGASEQSIALTYELFKAVTTLEQGMSIASLPQSVVALLDTTRARLSGPIVRDPEIIEEASIRMGLTKTLLQYRRGKFRAYKEGIAK